MNSIYNKKFNFWVMIEILSSCNLKCPNCYLHCDVRDEVVSADYILKYLKEWSVRIDCSHTLFSGGEPLLHPELEEILYKTRELLPDSVIYMMTNGLLFNSVPASTLKAIKTANVICTITAKPYKGLFGVDYFDEFNSCIAKVYTENIRYVVRNFKWCESYLKKNVYGDLWPVSNGKADPLAAYNSSDCVNCWRTQRIMDGEKLWSCLMPYIVHKAIESNLTKAKYYNKEFLTSYATLDDSDEEIYLKAIKCECRDVCRYCSYTTPLMHLEEHSLSEITSPLTNYC